MPETRQPYHDGFYTPKKTRARSRGASRSSKRCATQSIAALLKDDAAVDCRRAGLVVGSVIDPEKVGNPHIRAHASEGRLFRTVLEDALRRTASRARSSSRSSWRREAAAGLRRAATREIGRTLDGFGKTLGGPWRADEKAAADRGLARA